MIESQIYDGRIVEFISQPDSPLCSGISIEGFGTLIFEKYGFKDIDAQNAQEFARWLIDQGPGRAST
jgi:hypothetical protein